VDKMSDDLFGDVQDDSILDHIDDEMESSRFPSLLAELNALLRKELERFGYDPRHSIELVAAISSKIGGMQIYFPRGQVLEQLIRDMRIWRDFRGITFQNWLNATRSPTKRCIKLSGVCAGWN
jgi:Mor family transcriptional regulator